jgi:hypothetical protein
MGLFISRLISIKICHPEHSEGSNRVLQIIVVTVLSYDRSFVPQDDKKAAISFPLQEVRGLKLQLQQHRAMVRMPCLRQYRNPLNIIFQFPARHGIIDAPAQILSAGIGTETPPRIIVWFFIMVPEGIHKPRLNKMLHPFPFLRQKSGRVGI